MSFWPHPDDKESDDLPQAIADVYVPVHKSFALVERMITLRKNGENKYRWFYRDMEPASPEFDSMDEAQSFAPNRDLITFRTFSRA